MLIIFVAILISGLTILLNVLNYRYTCSLVLQLGQFKRGDSERHFWRCRAMDDFIQDEIYRIKSMVE